MATGLWKSIQVQDSPSSMKNGKERAFQRMGELLRASKSRLVTQIREAPNGEERLKLHQDNIKSLHEWKDFLKENTRAKFKSEYWKVSPGRR